MPHKRRKYSAQFKAEAVQMVIEAGAPIAQVAKDLQLVRESVWSVWGSWRSMTVSMSKSTLSRRLLMIGTILAALGAIALILDGRLLLGVTVALCVALLATLSARAK